MGRAPTKAMGNPYFEARKRASEFNEKLSSRAGAAELLHVSVDVVTDAELDLYKSLPVELIVRMADLYQEPQLLSTYCLRECPIGRNNAISDKVLTIERVTVKLLRKMRVEQLESMKDRLLDIAEDGMISEDEIEDVKSISEYLDSLSRTISELRTIAKKITGARS